MQRLTGRVQILSQSLQSDPSPIREQIITEYKVGISYYGQLVIFDFE